jgi:uncharacterized protein (DUF1778 family)
MDGNSERGDHPISVRLPEADVALIDRAARLRGRSRADFMREAAIRAAEDVLTESRLIHMSPEGFDAFLAILSEPARPVPEMVELSRRAAPWDADSVRKS